MTKNYIKLFITSLIGTLIFASYSYFVSRKYYIGICIMAILVNLFGAYNICQLTKKDSNVTKVIYAVGGAFGAVFGVLISQRIN